MKEVAEVLLETAMIAVAGVLVLILCVELHEMMHEWRDR
jgi:hypothetical protein